MGVAAVVALTSAQLVRQTGTPSWRSIWAEDGAVYGRDSFGLPLWRTPFRGYGGYVQFVPRVLAGLARAVGVSGAAAAFAMSATVVTALLALFVFRCTEGWIDDLWLRVVLTAMSALAPVAYAETNANIANLGWPLLIASAWAIVSRQTRPVDSVVRAGVLVATALSTTVAIALLPVAVAMAALRRARREWLVVAAFSTAVVVQLLLDRTAAAAPPYRVSSSVGDLFAVFGVRVLGGVVIGERWLGDAWRAWHYGVVLLAIAVLVALAVVCRRAGRDRWAFAVGALVMAFVVFAGPVWIRGSEPMRLHASGLRPDGARYLLAPIVLVVSGLVVLVDGAQRVWLRRIVALHAVVLIVVGFHIANVRSVSTPWDVAVQRGQADCQAKAPDAVTRLPIAPARWVMLVPCARVR